MTARLAKLFDTTQKTVADLSKREIIVSRVLAVAERMRFTGKKARTRRYLLMAFSGHLWPAL